jgi:Flp pilus assembly pilin Flp
VELPVRLLRVRQQAMQSCFRNKLGVMRLLAKARRTRGATMVEYALLIIAIMFLAAVAYRNLGKSARKNADESSGVLLQR